MYDANSNPRHLREVAPEAEEAQYQALEGMERDLDRLRKKNGVFTSKGWELIREELIAEWQRGDEAIRSRKTAVEDIQFLRGQLQAIEWLLNLSTQTRKSYALHKKRFDELKEQAG